MRTEAPNKYELLYAYNYSEAHERYTRLNSWDPNPVSFLFQLVIGKQTPEELKEQVVNAAIGKGRQI